MKPPEHGAFLSISAGAAREFFDIKDIKGLRIRTIGDTITLRGVESRSGSDVVAVETRGRGGLAALVAEKGTQSGELFRLLRRHGFKSTAPFFLLVERPRSWVGLEHWPSSNPPINRPHMRVWMNDPPTGRGRRTAEPATRQQRAPQRRPIDDDSDAIDWRQVRRILTDAKDLVSRRGRPSQAMEAAREQARRHLDQFERLIETIVPGRSAATMQARLDRAVAMLEQTQRERDEAHEEVQALQQVLDEERAERANQTVQRPEPVPEEEKPRRRGGRRRRHFVVSDPEPEDVADADEWATEQLADQPGETVEEPVEEPTEEIDELPADPLDEPIQEISGEDDEVEEAEVSEGPGEDEGVETGGEPIEEPEPEDHTEPPVEAVNENVADPATADQPESQHHENDFDDEYDPLIDPHRHPRQEPVPETDKNNDK